MITRAIKLCILICILGYTGAHANAEYIDSFSAEYDIAPSGEVTVIETIDYHFYGKERHGIFRTLLHVHPQEASVWYKKRTVEIEVLSVTRDGESEPFTVAEQNAKTEIKIGDPDVVFSNLQTYIITYKIRGALSSGPEGAELYYNVTGNQWEVPISVASVRVVSPALLDTFACYQGVVGDTKSCTSSIKDGAAVFFTANSIQPGEGLTIATALDAGNVTVQTFEAVTYLLFGSIMAFFWALFLIIYVFRFRRVHYKKMPVIAQYEPYQGYLPMYTGYLFDTQLDPKDITAGILYLAEQGFIKISKTDRKVLFVIPVSDYTITLQKPLSEIPTTFLKTVSELLFAAEAIVGTAVLLSSLTSERVKNAERILNLKRDLETDLKERGFLAGTMTDFKAVLPKMLGAFLILFGWFFMVPDGAWLVLSVFLGTFVILLFMLMPRKTVSWYEAQNHIAGFKLFLSVTDKERFDFHNAPENSPELFMQYLPYAVALGVEEKWAKVFEGITIAQPDWYEGGNITAFSAGALTSDISAFSTALASNSGVSGSSGGGSSGGGGGGGGGGSW